MYLGPHRSKAYIPHHLVISLNIFLNQFTLCHCFVFIIILCFNLTDHFMFVCCPLLYISDVFLFFKKNSCLFLLLFVLGVYWVQIGKQREIKNNNSDNSLELSGSVDLIWQEYTQWQQGVFKIRATYLCFDWCMYLLMCLNDSSTPFQNLS